MKTFCAALAAALIVSSAGCTAMRSCGGCNAPCHVTQSQFAPRASMQMGRCNQNCGVCGCMKASYHDGCSDCCECGDACCDSGCYGGGYCQGGACGPCGCNGCCAGSCLQRGISGVIDCTCHRDSRYDFAPGPAVGQVAYPYYTVRGPRDFLMANPPTIGPR